MKKARKGFTLVELLIVVAILASLTASMTVAVSGSTAKAKASTIAANVDACVTAVSTYVANNIGVKTTDTVDAVLLAAIPRWGSFTQNDNLTKYKATAATDDASTTGIDESKDPKQWVLNVSFVDEADAADIATALAGIRGYDKVYATDNNGALDSGTNVDLSTNKMFKVTLYNGKIEALTSWPTN